MHFFDDIASRSRKNTRMLNAPVPETTALHRMKIGYREVAVVLRALFKRRHYFAAVFALLILTTPAFADEDRHSGNSIFDGCNTDPDVFNRADIVTKSLAFECLGAIQGVMFMGIANREICPPDNFTGNQERKIVVKYMSDHPDKLNLPYPELILTALRNAWPCQ
jgi:hypothetical protein